MTNGSTTCHVLPCGMNQDLTAPIGRYFHPTPIRKVVVREHGSTTLDIVKLLGDEKDISSTLTTMLSQEGDDKKKEVEKEEVGKGGAEEEVAVVLTAQFRGRGLLCIADSQKTTTTSIYHNTTL